MISGSGSQTFEEIAREIFHELSGGKEIGEEEGNVMVDVSRMAQGFKRLIDKHHDHQREDDLKYKELEKQLDEIHESFAAVEEQVKELNGDKTISMRIPEKPIHLKPKADKDEDDSSNESVNSFRPDDGDNDEDVKRKEKDLKHKQKERKAHEKETISKEKDTKMPRDGLPELYNSGNLPPNPEVLIQVFPPDSTEHV